VVEVCHKKFLESCKILESC